jgi:hypothetical protein
MADVFITGLCINVIDGLMYIRNIHQGDVENLANAATKSGQLKLILTVKISDIHVYRAFLRADYGNAVKEVYEGRWAGRFYRRIQRDVNNKAYTEVVIVKGLVEPLAGDLVRDGGFVAVPILANDEIFKSVLKAKISPGLAKWIKENTIIEKEEPAEGDGADGDAEPAEGDAEPAEGDEGEGEGDGAEDDAEPADDDDLSGDD